MFTPKKTKGGSYTFPVDSYGQFPTIREMFLEIQPTATTTGTENIFSTVEFIENAKYLEIQNKTVETIQYYSTLIGVYSQQSSLVIMNNIISTIELQTQTGLYNTSLEKYSTSYNEYQSSIRVYENYSTIEAMSISKYMNEYNGIINETTTDLNLAGGDSNSFIQVLQTYMDNLPEEHLYNFSISYLSSLVRTYSSMYSRDLSNFCTIVSTQLNPELSTIQSLISISTLIYAEETQSIPYDVNNEYVKSIHETNLDVHYSAYIKMLEYIISTQQAIYLNEAESLVLEATEGGYYDTCINSINKLSELGGIYNLTTTAMGGGGTEEKEKTPLDIYPELKPKIMGLINNSGKIQDLQNTSSIQISNIQKIQDTLNEISSGTVKLGVSSSKDLRTQVISNAYEFSQNSKNANKYMSTQMSYELESYINTLQSLSSFLLRNILENKKEIQETTYNSLGISLTNVDELSTYHINTLSTNSQKTRTLMRANSTFINMLNAEAFAKQYYFKQKSAYEAQSYYSIVSDPKYNPSYFNQLASVYPLSIQNVNRYVSNREAYYNAFVASLKGAIIDGVLQPDVSTQLYQPSIDFISMTQIPPILELQMKFDNVPSMIALFSQRELPPEVMLSCPSTPVTYESNVEDRIIPTMPSLTDTIGNYGVQGQYISIQKPDNNIEILQIIVIDSTGKNVAFETSVSAPNILQQTTSSTETSNVVPLSVIVSGTYDTASPQSFSFISGPNETATLGTAKTIWINLGTTYDITAIQYLKSSESSYNSVGFIFQIYASDQKTPVGKPKKTVANTPTEIIDFRVNANSHVPISIIPLRKGNCGILARYVKIAPSSSGILQISQVAIVSSDGSNLALGITPIFVGGFSEAMMNVPYITDGSYYSRPLSSCFTVTTMSTDSYLEFDLGTEKDITAVHLYNTNTEPSYQFETTIELFTDDNQLAIQKIALTDDMKEIIDFRFASSNETCPDEMLWPSYYGVAGIIAQYIGIEKTDSTALGFSKIQLIDKSGRDVGLFQPTIVSSVPTKSYIGVTNYESSQISSISYVSNVGPPAQLFVVDLQKSYEICAVNILACSDGPELLENTTLNFYNENPFIHTKATAFYTKPIHLTNLSSFFDTRYQPDSSSAPTSVDPTKTNYGSFGTMAISATIPGIYLKSSIEITEAAGQDLSPNSIFSTIGGSTHILFNSASNIFEINSIVINDPTAVIGSFITLYGCDDVVVNIQPLQRYTDSSLQNPEIFTLADFRNPLKSSYAPMAPLDGVRYSDLRVGSTEHTHLTEIYGAVNTDTGHNNLPPKGLLAQYVKIIPSSSATPMYISQIVIVDSNGMNIAFEKDTYTPKSSIEHTTKYAVDGTYALSIEDPNYNILLSLHDYISRPTSSSFVSVAGPQEENYLVINLGAEYFVNSVIYVSSKDKFNAGLGVLVELYDSNLRRIGVRVVSKYVSLFGVDVLDFRQDRTEAVSDPGAWLEVRPRVVQLGQGCGMMGQYIRIVSAIAGQPFQVSQLIITDSSGNNIALYKPVYSSTNQPHAYRLVDGAYYQRLPKYAYLSIPQNDPSTDYIEVNFGNEIAILNLYVINTLNATDYSIMKIIVYNKDRDIIATLNLGQANYMNLPLTTQNFFVPSNTNNSKTIPVYNTKMPVLGVNILTKLSPFLVNGGLLPGTAIPPADTPATEVQTTFPVEALCSNVPPTSANLNNKFTRGPNNEIPGRFVRVYNVNQYIQVSQIMVYANDGTNYAYQAPATAESVYPGTYITTVTDGQGGYFHTARPWAQCYKSGGKIYDFLQVDLGATRQIAAIRCVFASDDQGQNIGASIQILSEQDGDPDAILAQHIVGTGEYKEALVDFRYPAGQFSIQQIIMPKIHTLPNLPSGILGPIAAVEGSDGTLYVVDMLNHCVWSTSGLFYGNPGTPGLLSYPTGIATDGNFFYISDYGNNRIVRVDASRTGIIYIAFVNNPYALLCSNGNLICTSYNNGGHIYVYNTSNLVQTFSTGIPFPSSVVIADAYYVTSDINATVYRLGADGVGVPYIASSNAQVILPLKSTSSVAYDSSENILFISDFIQDKIFAVLLGTNPVETYNLAGTGNGGYSGDGLQGVLATMDGPKALTYSLRNGYLYICDYKNKTIRYLELYSKPSTSYSTTTASPAWFGWTTETLPPVIFTPTAPPSITPATDTNKLTQIVQLATISTLFTGANITAFYCVNSNLYYAAGNSIMLYSFTTKTSSTVSSSFTFGNITCIISDNVYLYLCDSTNNTIYKMSFDGSNTSVFLGGGTTTDAPLSNPTWIGFDKNGTFYVSDTGNYCIRRKNGFGQLEAYAGQMGVQGTTATNTGTNYGVLVTLNSPGAFAFDANNYLIFIDAGSNTVYQIASENRISPICPGGPTMMGWYVSDTGTLQSTSTAARVEFSDTYYKLSQIPGNSVNIQLRNPSGITIDASGSIYISASGGQQIVEFTFNSFTGIYVPSIIAGFGSDTIGRTISTDNYAKYASLNNPTILQIYNNELYFLDNAANIRNIKFEVITTLPLNLILPYGPLLYIGNNTKNTYNTSASSGTHQTIGILEEIQSNFICCSSVGTVYLGNNIGNAVIAIDSNNVLSIISSGFGTIAGIAVYSDTVLYVADSTNNVIQTILLSTKAVQTLLTVTGIYALAINPIGYLFYSFGTSVGCYNIKDASVTGISISISENVSALAVDTDGNLYVSTPTKIYQYIILYSKSGPTVSTNSALPLASYGGAYNGMTFYNGNLYFSSLGASSVCYIPVIPSIGTPVVIIGQNSIKGPAIDGSYSNTVSLNQPAGLCIDVNRNLFLLDIIPQTGQSTLLRNTNYMSLQGGLTYTIAGTNTVGSASDYLSNTFAYLELFNSIGGVCYDSLGKMYVSDTGNHVISVVDLSGMISTYVGAAGKPGYSGDGGLASLARLKSPSDIKMSQSNVMYIADTGNNCIRRVKVYNDGYRIETFGGQFSSPSALAIDSNENVFVVYSNSPIQSTTSQTTTASGITTSSIAWITPTKQVYTYYTANYAIGLIAFNSSNQLFYTTSDSIYTVLNTENTNFIDSTSPLKFMSGLSNPRGLYFDASDNLYVSDTGNNKVYKILAAELGNLFALGGTNVSFDSVYAADKLAAAAAAAAADATAAATAAAATATWYSRLTSAPTYDAASLALVDATANLPSNIRTFLNLDDVAKLYNTYFISKYQWEAITYYSNNTYVLNLWDWAATNAPTTDLASAATAASVAAKVMYDTWYVTGGYDSDTIKNYINATFVWDTAVGAPAPFIRAKAYAIAATVLAANSMAAAEHAAAADGATTAAADAAAAAAAAAADADSAAAALAAFSITNYTTFIGNGLVEPFYTIVPSIAQNISANGTIPTDRALYAPGPLALDPIKGLLVGQPTKITLYNFNNSVTVPPCGVVTTTIKINNTTTYTLYLSQIIVLNNSGLNIALGSQPYQDGFYGCKPTSSAYAISAGTNLTFTVATNSEIVCILLYLGLNGNGYVKSNWNGAQLILGDNTRTIQNITDIYSLQYITFDYRKKTPACLAYNNYINKYKIQSSASTLSSSYTQRFIRYMRITADSGFVSLSQVAIIHADTGVDLGVNSILSTSNSATSQLYTNSMYYVETNPVSTIDTWIEFDLGDEYPIEQVILYSNNKNISYTIVCYTNMRNQVQLPVISTPNNLVAYIGINFFNQPSVILTVRVTDSNNNTTILYIDNNTNSYSETSITPTYIQTIQVQNASQKVNLFFYNSAHVLIYSTPVVFANFILSPYISSIISYSFAPLVGTKNVRYIQYNLSNGTSIQISQIIAIDINGINVAYNKGNTTITQTSSLEPLSSPYTTPDNIQIDLGSEYEIIEVIYVNGADNQSNSNGCQIVLTDSFNNSLATYTVKGSTPYETWDTRNTMSVSLVYSPTASIEPVFTGALRGQYIRFENPTGTESGFSINNVMIYDVYGKCVSIGKETYVPVDPTTDSTNILKSAPITTSSSQNALQTTGYANVNIIPGDWWEINLGQEHSIKDIFVTTSLTIPYSVYDFYRREVYRSFTSGNVSSPFVQPTNPPVIGSTQQIQFIRISGVREIEPLILTHLSVIDTRGMDVCVWKSGRLISSTGAVSYSTLDGRYLNPITITSTFDIDLGKPYPIASIVPYGTGGQFLFNTYDSLGVPVDSKSLIPSDKIIPVGDDSPYTSVQNTIQYGKKTRYIKLSKELTFNFNTLAVIDSLGRNVAYNANITYNGSGSTFSLPYNLTETMRLNSINSVLIDLGQEYYIAFITVYSVIPSAAMTITSALTFNATLTGVSVNLLDALYNSSASYTLAGSGSNYNILYPIGNIFDRVVTNTNIKNISITLANYDTSLANANLNCIFIDSNSFYTLSTAASNVSTVSYYANSKYTNSVPKLTSDISVSSPSTFTASVKELLTGKIAASYPTQESISYSLNAIVYTNISYYKTTTGTTQNSQHYCVCGYGLIKSSAPTPVLKKFPFICQLKVLAGTWYYNVSSIYYPFTTQYGDNIVNKCAIGGNKAFYITGNNNVYKVSFSMSTTNVFNFTTDSTLNIGRIASDIVADTSNNFYVSSGAAVYKYNVSGNLLATYSQYNDLSNTSTNFKTINKLCIDKNNYVYASDKTDNAVHVISPTGNVNLLSSVALPSLLTINPSSPYKIYILSGDTTVVIKTVSISSLPNSNLPFISNVDTTYYGTYPTTSTTGIQISNSNLAGGTFAETLDCT